MLFVLTILIFNVIIDKPTKSLCMKAACSLPNVCSSGEHIHVLVPLSLLHSVARCKSLKFSVFLFLSSPILGIIQLNCQGGRIS